MKNTIFTMCMVALSTVGFSQETTTTFKYPVTGFEGDTYQRGYRLVARPYSDLALISENNLKLQKAAHTNMVVGFIMTALYPLVTTPDSPMNGLLIGGSAFTMLGGIQLLSVNSKNTKITFALTHPMEMSN